MRAPFLLLAPMGRRTSHGWSAHYPRKRAHCGDRPDDQYASWAAIEPEEGAPGPQLWMGLVTTPPGGVSGWHHHGSCVSGIYVVIPRHVVLS